jgi:hypothetical protein
MIVNNFINAEDAKVAETTKTKFLSSWKDLCSCLDELNRQQHGSLRDDILNIEYTNCFCALCVSGLKNILLSNLRREMKVKN